MMMKNFASVTEVTLNRLVLPFWFSSRASLFKYLIRILFSGPNEAAGQESSEKLFSAIHFVSWFPNIQREGKCK